MKSKRQHSSMEPLSLQENKKKYMTAFKSCHIYRTGDYMVPSIEFDKKSTLDLQLEEVYDIILIAKRRPNLEAASYFELGTTSTPSHDEDHLTLPLPPFPIDDWHAFRTLSQTYC